MSGTSPVEPDDWEPASRTSGAAVGPALLDPQSGIPDGVDRKSASGESTRTEEPLVGKRADSFEYDEGRGGRASTAYGRTIMTILGLVGLAVGVALAQHFVYRYLDGKPTSVLSQAWASRIGTGFAFLVKALLGGGIVVVYWQVVWFSVRRRLYSIDALDGLFSLLDDPFRFFDPGVFAGAMLAAAVALLAWTLPLALLFTPSSLSLTAAILPSPYGSITFPTFPLSDTNGTIYGIDSLGYIRTPTMPLTRITTLALYSGMPQLPSPSPCTTDCSFSTSFFGPALSCTAFAENANEAEVLAMPEVRAWLGNQTANFLYFGQGVFDSTTNTTFVAFGWQTAASYYNGSSQLMDVVRCVVYNASYALAITSSSHSLALAAAPNVTLLSPLSFDLTLPSFSTLPSPTRPAPALLLPFTPSLPAFLVFYSTVQAFLAFVEGSIVPGSTGPGINGTSVPLASFAGGSGLMPFGTISEGIEVFQGMMVNLTVSMLVLSGDTQTVSAVDIGPQLVYGYDPRALWIPYALVLALSLLCTSVGIWALSRTGRAASKSFSQVLLASRNEALDVRVEKVGGGEVRDGVVRGRGREGVGVLGEGDLVGR